MEILTRLGVFLLVLGLIVFGSKLLLSKRTREQLKELEEPVPAFYESHNRLLARIIVILALVILAIFVIMNR